MEWWYMATVAVFTYLVLVFVFISLTKEKLNARSGLLGTGIATMVSGFFWNNFLMLKLSLDGVYWKMEWIYTALSTVCLLIGLGGIIMIVVYFARE